MRVRLLVRSRGEEASLLSGESVGYGTVSTRGTVSDVEAQLVEEGVGEDWGS